MTRHDRIESIRQCSAASRRHQFHNQCRKVVPFPIHKHIFHWLEMLKHDPKFLQNSTKFYKFGIHLHVISVGCTACTMNISFVRTYSEHNVNQLNCMKIDELMERIISALVLQKYTIKFACTKTIKNSTFNAQGGTVARFMYAIAKAEKTHDNCLCYFRFDAAIWMCWLEKQLKIEIINHAPNLNGSSSCRLRANLVIEPDFTINNRIYLSGFERLNRHKNCCWN